MDREDRPYTAKHLLEHLDEVVLSEDTIAAIAAVVKERTVDVMTACFHTDPYAHYDSDSQRPGRHAPPPEGASGDGRCLHVVHADGGAVEGL